MNKPFGQLTANLQGPLEQFLADLDASYADLRGNAVRLLESISGQGQLNLGPSVSAATDSNPPGEQEANGAKAPTLNTQVVEAAIRALTQSTFTVVDVRKGLRKGGTSLTDQQISTAFRKLASRKRPPSPLEKVREAMGSEPSVYRLVDGR